jgi:hypothetical protein
MSECFRFRRLVALVAAYVMALQGLLLPLSVVAYATADAGLCAAAPLHPVPPSGDDGSPCPCAAGCGMQCCAPVLAAPPHAGVAPAPWDGERIASLPVAASVVRPALHGSQHARAPPLN